MRKIACKYNQKFTSNRLNWSFLNKLIDLNQFHTGVHRMIEYVNTYLDKKKIEWDLPKNYSQHYGQDVILSFKAWILPMQLPK